MPPNSIPALSPVVLEGRWVRLEPLTLAHVPKLADVAFDEELWKWTVEQVRAEADLEAYVQRALDQRSTGTALPFATVELSSGRAIGSTRFAQF